MTEYSPQIRRLLGLTLAGFAVLCLALTYWQVAMAPRLNADQYNQRQRLRLQRVKPGRLYTVDGELALDRQRVGKGWSATYPQGRYFSHLTGYNAQTGLQKGLGDALFAQGTYANPWRELLRGQPVGDDVVLTINAAGQRVATEEMEGKRGAVVALDPASGAVLALVSAPGYDPALVTSSDAEYDLFRLDPQSPELNRSLQGLYPPGSVFKLFTAAVALDLGLVTPETRFTCAGRERVNKATIVCRRPGGHGSLDLNTALYDSCNVVFAKLAARIGVEDFISYGKRFHLLDQADLALPSMLGRMYDFRGFKGKVALAEAGFGQGATMLTPLQVARLTATIANRGHVLQPYLVDAVRTPEGQVVSRGQARDFGQAVKPETAASVAGMMEQVVERGTGRGIAMSSVRVAAKTGSAETRGTEPHAWFTCFAPADKPRVVVTVVVEHGGAGREAALPIARRVLSTLLEQARSQ
jgi:peptidoglycan glycosyltransferase